MLYLNLIVHLTHMKNTQCPICFSELEVRDCTPCDDCGGDPQELEDLKANKHIYRRYEIYKGLTLTLCNFCDVDFGSYHADYFGFTNGKRIGYQHFRELSELKLPAIAKDKYCTVCYAKLKFLNFLAEIRQMNKEEV